MAANRALKIIGGIAIVLSLSYCSEWPKYRFERAATETGHRIPGARLISSMKTGDLASPVSWFWSATTTWSFAFPDPLLRDRFYTFTLIYDDELSPIISLVDADCEAREEVLYDLDEPESAFPARDFFGEPVVAPNGKTYRRAKKYTNIASPPEWLHAFCETDWTAERKGAGLGNADAQTHRGSMYEYGDGVPKDFAEAARWYRTAAEQGNANAQASLGFMYDTGKGVPKDEAEAARWYRKAAEQGNARAQYNLGLKYRYGQGVPKDFAEAYMWLSLAAPGGDKLTAEPRDRLKNSMTVQQIAEGQRRTAAWRPKHSGE